MPSTHSTENVIELQTGHIIMDISHANITGHRIICSGSDSSETLQQCNLGTIKCFAIKGGKGGKIHIAIKTKFLSRIWAIWEKQKCLVYINVI